MDYNTKLEKLKEVAYEAIELEDLPRPVIIKYRRSLGGIRSRSAFCKKIFSHLHNATRYTITLNTTAAKFFKDPKGKFFDKKTNIKYSKAVCGNRITFPRIVRSMAHELAHTKFWGHNASHVSYMEHLELLLLQMLNERGIEVEKWVHKCE